MPTAVCDNAAHVGLKSCVRHVRKFLYQRKTFFFSAKDVVACTGQVSYFLAVPPGHGGTRYGKARRCSRRTPGAGLAL